MNGRPLLTDFGLSSIHFRRPRNTYTTVPGEGTLRYQPPENTLGPESTSLRHQTTDCFSFAMTLFHLVYSQRPFHSIVNDFIVVQKIQRGERPHREADFCQRARITEAAADLFWRLLEDMWDQNKYHRPSIPNVETILDRFVNVDKLISLSPSEEVRTTCQASRSLKTDS